MLVIDDNFPSTRIEHDNVIVLQELCSNASPEQILLCLNENDGDVNRAAQELLGIFDAFIPDEIDTIDDDTTPAHKSTPEKMKTVSESLSPYDALKDFQMKNVRENAPRENFYISRLEARK